jgi:type I restriction enzyme S subunit
VNDVIIPVPPIAEQKKIIEEIELRLSVNDYIENVVKQTLKQSEWLRQSILKRAFEGQLVHQNPNDEPAEKLLERIKEEKTRQVTNKGTIDSEPLTNTIKKADKTVFLIQTELRNYVE